MCHVHSVERLVGRLKAVGRNTNAHEIGHNEEEQNPDVTVEEVWCLALQGAVGGGHCECSEELETSQESRNTTKNIENNQQGAEVKILVGAGPLGETFARTIHRKGAKFEDLEQFLQPL